jgi:hypothetical protein
MKGSEESHTTVSAAELSAEAPSAIGRVSGVVFGLAARGGRGGFRLFAARSSGREPRCAQRPHRRAPGDPFGPQRHSMLEAHLARMHAALQRGLRHQEADQGSFL